MLGMQTSWSARGDLNTRRVAPKLRGTGACRRNFNDLQSFSAVRKAFRHIGRAKIPTETASVGMNSTR